MDILNTNSGFQKTRRFVGQKLRNLGVRYSKAGTVQIWRERARVCVARREFDQAIDCRRNAVKLDPSNPHWRMELVRELLLAGRAEEAKAADGGVALVWRMLGQELSSRHEDRLALYCWRRAMDLDPSDSHAQQELVRTFVTKRQFDIAHDLSASLDATKLPKSYDRRYYKDFTAEEKCTLLEASLVTIASPEAIVELIRAVRHVLLHSIPGALVECGTFKGGNAVVMIRTLVNAGISDRDIYLYDTFEGFPKPEAIDFEYFVGPALETWRKFKAAGDETEDGSDWLRYPLEKVKERVLALGYPAQRIHFVKGLVENTIPQEAPEKIAVLRLDTDFYRSTKHELTHLYPRLQHGGILIIDDYGALEGSRKATDEYLKEHNVPFFPGRVDEHVRIGVKP